jgi:hypothetical protein
MLWGAVTALICSELGPSRMLGFAGSAPTYTIN